MKKTTRKYLKRTYSQCLEALYNEFSRRDREGIVKKMEMLKNEKKQ